MISRRTLLATVAAAPLASALPRAAFAAYPDKPMRLIVPFAAGGNADFVARLCGEGMSADARPAVRGRIPHRRGRQPRRRAWRRKAAPDGYTLFTGSNGPLTVNPFVQAKLGYDPLKDFVAIGLANLAPHCIAVHAVGEGEDHARTDRDVEDNAGEPRHRRRGQRLAHDARALRRGDRREHHARALSRRRRIVPDLLSGNITGAMTELSTVLPQISGGKVRMLGVASNTRSPQLPDVPTMIEQGVKDFTAASYVGVLVPAAHAGRDRQGARSAR